MKKIINGTYEDLLFYAGYKMKDKLLAREIREGKANYYLIYNNSEIITDFWVFISETNPSIVDLAIQVNTANPLFENEELMQLIFDKLKKDKFSEAIIEIYNDLEDKIALAKHYGFNEIDKNKQLIRLKKELS